MITKSLRKAFSLVELSVIMTIISIIIMGYITIGNAPLIDESDKYIETYEKMRIIDNAIKDFVSKYKRLPCPSKNTIPYGDISTEIYNLYSYNFPSDTEYMANTQTSNGATCISSLGSVPTKTLNLPEYYMLDSWGNKINLHVSSNLCGNISNNSNCNQQSYDENRGNITVTDLQTNIAVSNVAYVLISHGANGYGAYTKSGKVTSAKFTSSPEHINRSSKSVGNSDYNKYYKITLNSVIDDILLFSTKLNIRSSKNIPSNPVINSVDCNVNSNNLNSLTKSNLQNIRNNLTVTRKCNGICSNNNYYNNGDEAVLDMMWVLQEACFELHKTPKKCPLGGTYSATTNDCNI